jgi:glycosyltransferase involved in cell wall biosynthesis
MGGGGVQRIVKFLKYFNHSKYDVGVLTVKKSLFYAYDQTLQSEIPAKVNIVKSGSLDPFRLINIFSNFFRSKSKKAAQSPTVNESGEFLRKLSMKLFIPDSRILWFPFALNKLWHLHQAKSIDILIASMPPFTAGLVGILFKKWMGSSVILDFRDAWIDNPYNPEMSQMMTRLNAKIESYCLRNADGLIFVNPALQEHYMTKYQPLSFIPNTCIRNGFDEEDFKDISSKTASNSDSPFKLGIMGSVYSQGNRPLSLLKALQEMVIENSRLEHQLKLILIGKWTADFLKHLGSFNFPHGLVEVIPYQTHINALNQASKFDALTLSIEENFRGSTFVTPGRIYEYLRLKKPILAICPLSSDLTNVVKDHQAGKVIGSDDVEGIKNQLYEWIYNKSTFSREYKFVNIKKVSRQKQTTSLENLIEKILASEDSGR